MNFKQLGTLCSLVYSTRQKRHKNFYLNFSYILNKKKKNKNIYCHVDIYNNALTSSENFTYKTYKKYTI